MIKFVHIRKVDDDGNFLSHGGITVGYTTTENEIILCVAACHDNDRFNYEIGRRIVTGRLKSPRVMPTVIALKHPITSTIVDHIANDFFDTPVLIWLDDGDWVTQYEPLEVADDEWIERANKEFNDATIATQVHC